MQPEEQALLLSQAMQIYQIWVKVKDKSGCGKPKMTAKRTKQLETAITDFGFDKVKAVMEFFLTDHKYAVYMRNNNHVGLDNILRKTKFTEKHALATRGSNERFKDLSQPTTPEPKKMAVENGVYLPWVIVGGNE